MQILLALIVMPANIQIQDNNRDSKMSIHDYPELKALLLDLMTANNGELSKAFSLRQFHYNDSFIAIDAYIEEMSEDLLEERMCEALAGDGIVKQAVKYTKQGGAAGANELQDYIIDQRNEILTIDINQFLLEMHSVVEECQGNVHE